MTLPSHKLSTEQRLEALAKGMIVAAWARVKPDSTAIVSPHGERTFAELNANANRLARALRRQRISRGDGVAILSSNRPEFAEVLSATQRCGLRLTTVNWHLTAEEAAYIVADCGAKALVADARFAEAAIGVAQMAPGAAVRLSIGGDIDGFEQLAEMTASEDGSDVEDPVLGTTMLYTSGTTGRPKGVFRPPGAALTTAVAARSFVEASRVASDVDSLHLCTGPLYHAAPLAFSMSLPFSQGMGVVMMDGWDAEECLRLIERDRITHSHMVPTMFHRLLSLPEQVRASYDLSSLRFVVHGAAPCPVPIKQAIIDWWGPVVHEYYAATEGVATFVTAEEWLERPGTVGKPASSDLVKILDESGNESAPGEVGTIFIRAPEASAFSYYNDPVKTASAYRGGYFTLGDVGYLDADGYLFLTDRSVDLIISGGVNIYPAEVEAALITHPAVGDVAVIGVPNTDWGEEVKAVVESKPGVPTSSELEAELVAWCRERLAAFKCPRSVDFVDALPRHDNGKLYKQILRTRYRQSQERESQCDDERAASSSEGRA
jgi:long-chain acyl-CoA synthetase